MVTKQLKKRGEIMLLEITKRNTLYRALIFSQFCETLTDNLGALATLAIKQQRNCLALISACS